MHPLLSNRPPTLVIGTDTVRNVLANAGIPVVTDPVGARAVVLGADPMMTYTDLAEAMKALDRGATFLALNLDLRLPVEHGVAVPGTGAIAAALTAATGVQPVVVGKPSVFFFREALRRYGISAEDTAMVGDSLVTDIAGGAGVGLLTVLVGDQTFERESIHPDIAVADMAELQRLLERGGK
jgi:4-nitrophenyl phosphatase